VNRGGGRIRVHCVPWGDSEERFPGAEVLAVQALTGEGSVAIKAFPFSAKGTVKNS